MVKLSVDQTIQAELNGNWLQATVVQVDYSLVLLRFPSGNVEWLYRGSKRLAPISVIHYIFFLHQETLFALFN